jgi:hypothetical protein
VFDRSSPAITKMIKGGGYAAFLKSQNRNDVARYWMQQFFEKKRTLWPYWYRIERRGSAKRKPCSKS